ncbi:hypothetical protein AB0F88_17145 [Streptosporangium sp. NPDC023963]|uniref:hypothetical protein n=1 Tax=Streptosporangium sp. NPDC023963 TaxID=3155608 RepID=UPI00342734A2
MTHTDTTPSPLPLEIAVPTDGMLAAAIRHQQMSKLIEEVYAGDAVTALHDLADAGRLAVAYLDRGYFAGHLQERHGVELTDEMWKALQPHLEHYDEHVSGYVAPNVQRRFAIQAIQDAGILAEETPTP